MQLSPVRPSPSKLAYPLPSRPRSNRSSFAAVQTAAVRTDYDFNYSNGRCYPNAYKAPGVYARPIPDDPPRGYGYYRSQRYGDPRYAPGYYPRY
ncbi:hypothetical protein ACVWWR_007373 [Bradyrhizobium sp. LM3.2]